MFYQQLRHQNYFTLTSCVHARFNHSSTLYTDTSNAPSDADCLCLSTSLPSAPPIFRT
eukprot:Awhi_evm1s2267